MADKSNLLVARAIMAMFPVNTEFISANNKTAGRFIRRRSVSGCTVIEAIVLREI